MSPAKVLMRTRLSVVASLGARFNVGMTLMTLSTCAAFAVRVSMTKFVSSVSLLALAIKSVRRVVWWSLVCVREQLISTNEARSAVL